MDPPVSDYTLPDRAPTKRYNARMRLPDAVDIAIVDVETTGGSPSANRVIEIGIIRLTPQGSARRYQSVVNPGCPVPSFIRQLTGISTAETDAAPTFEEIAPQVSELLKDAVFVAHNARFDYGFIKQEFARLGLPFTARTLCSARLSRALYPQHRHHDLSSIITRFGLSVSHRHRALDDAEAVERFIDKACAELGEPAVTAAAERLLGRAAARTGLPAAMFDGLPEAPGVYIFKDAQGDPLYVGKSRNIRERVLSHFYEDTTAKKELEMTQKAASIEHIRTPGELSALLLESQLIKRLDPYYNRQLRRSAGPVCACRSTDERGYPTVTLTRHDGSIDDEAVLGFYRGVHQAKSALSKICEEHALCPRLIGLEKGKGPCFSHHLHKCRGACIGHESADSYGRRFEAAFPDKGPLHWPYPAAVSIEERGTDDGPGEVFIIERWRLLAHIRYDGSSGHTRVLDAEFEPDTCRVLQRALRGTISGARVRRLTRDQTRRLLEESA